MNRRLLLALLLAIILILLLGSSRLMDPHPIASRTATSGGTVLELDDSMRKKEGNSEDHEVETQRIESLRIKFEDKRNRYWKLLVRGWSFNMPNEDYFSEGQQRTKTGGGRRETLLHVAAGFIIPTAVDEAVQVGVKRSADQLLSHIMAKSAITHQSLAHSVNRKMNNNKSNRHQQKILASRIREQQSMYDSRSGGGSSTTTYPREEEGVEINGSSTRTISHTARKIQRQSLNLPLLLRSVHPSCTSTCVLPGGRWTTNYHHQRRRDGATTSTNEAPGLAGIPGLSCPLVPLAVDDGEEEDKKTKRRQHNNNNKKNRRENSRAEEEAEALSSSHHHTHHLLRLPFGMQWNVIQSHRSSPICPSLEDFGKMVSLLGSAAMTVGSSGVNSRHRRESSRSGSTTIPPKSVVESLLLGSSGDRQAAAETDKRKGIYSDPLDLLRRYSPRILRRVLSSPSSMLGQGDHLHHNNDRNHWDNHEGGDENIPVSDDDDSGLGLASLELLFNTLGCSCTYNNDDTNNATTARSGIGSTSNNAKKKASITNSLRGSERKQNPSTTAGKSSLISNRKPITVDTTTTHSSPSSSEGWYSLRDILSAVVASFSVSSSNHSSSGATKSSSLDPRSSGSRSDLTNLQMQDFVDCLPGSRRTTTSTGPTGASNSNGNHKTGGGTISSLANVPSTCHHLPGALSSPSTGQRMSSDNDGRETELALVHHRRDVFKPIAAQLLPEISSSRYSSSTQNGEKLRRSQEHQRVEEELVFSAEEHTTRVREYGPKSWLRLDNVCMTCEEEDIRYFMPPNTRCAPTVYSLGSTSGRSNSSSSSSSPAAHIYLEAAKKRGRTPLFTQRFGAFQYGGTIEDLKMKLNSQRKGGRRGDTAAERDSNHTLLSSAAWQLGTTFFNAPFPVSNVGHVIHEALWSWTQALVGKEELNLPKPYRFLDHPWSHEIRNNEFYTFLSRSVARFLLLFEENGADETAPPTLGRLESFPRDSSSFLCFESVVFAARDRSGKNSGSQIATREAVGRAIRASVLPLLPSFTSSSSSRVETSVKQGEGESSSSSSDSVPMMRQSPRIYVYGRNDVYRRSIDNIGMLYSVVNEVASSEEFQLLPDPPVLINTFYTDHPAAQIDLVSNIDVLITAQGAHEQMSSLFMPLDGVIIEIHPCHGARTSYVGRYGPFFPKTQTLRQIEVCGPPINRISTSGGGNSATGGHDTVAGTTNEASSSSSSIFSSTSMVGNKNGANMTLCYDSLRAVQLETRRAVRALLKNRKIMK